MQTTTNKLLGNWQSDPNDPVARHLLGNVLLEFREAGQLIYTIIGEKKKQVIQMTYDVQGNLLITEQPSTAQKEISEFYFSDGLLELVSNGKRTRYIRTDQKLKDNSASKNFFGKIIKRFYRG